MPAPARAGHLILTAHPLPHHPSPSPQARPHAPADPTRPPRWVRWASSALSPSHSSSRPSAPARPAGCSCLPASRRRRHFVSPPAGGRAWPVYATQRARAPRFCPAPHPQHVIVPQAPPPLSLSASHRVTFPKRKASGLERGARRQPLLQSDCRLGQGRLHNLGLGGALHCSDSTAEAAACIVDPAGQQRPCSGAGDLRCHRLPAAAHARCGGNDQRRRHLSSALPLGMGACGTRCESLEP